MPIIKLTSVKDTKLGKSAAKEVCGTKVGTTEEWKKAFFASDKELSDQLHEFEVGDFVNVVMKQTDDKKYWNIAEFKDVSDDEIEKATEGAKKFSKSGATRAPADYKRPDGGSRGDDTNRASAIYLAREIIMGAGDCPATAKEIAVETVKLAEMVNNYIKNGTPF